MTSEQELAIKDILNAHRLSVVAEKGDSPGWRPVQPNGQNFRLFFYRVSLRKMNADGTNVATSGNFTVSSSDPNGLSAGVIVKAILEDHRLLSTNYPNFKTWKAAESSASKDAYEQQEYAYTLLRSLLGRDAFLALDALVAAMPPVVSEEPARPAVKS